MTSSAESLVNGTQSSKDNGDSTKTLSPSVSSPTTPKAKVIPKIMKINGVSSENVSAEANGNRVGSSTQDHSSFLSPPPTSATTTSPQADVMEEIPSIESPSNPSDQGNPNEEEGSPSSLLKRDLYVGNLHPRVQPHMLKDLFGGDAMVENVKIVPDRNLSHGGLAYGFVTMVSRDAAELYMQALQNRVFFGLEIRINWATPTKSAEQGLSLFVGDIGPDVTVDDLRNAFQDPDNSVTDARIVMDPTSGRTKGYGFVTFQDSEAATKALSKNGEILKGRKMRVNWASTTKDQKPGSQQQFVPSPDAYSQAMPGIVRNEYQVPLSTMAQYDGLDVGWYLRLPQDFQAGIVRVSQEAPGAKVVWVGNLDKTTNQTDLMPLFSLYGLVEEITMVSPSGFAFVSMASHLAAATLIVIFKEYIIKGRKIKTGWSHSTQRQLQQAAAAAATHLQQTHPPQMIPPQPHHRAQPGLQMQPPQMTPLPPMAAPGYMYAQQPMLYNPYMQPVHPYPMVHPPNGTGTSTPRSATSGSVTPATHDSKPKETPSPR